MSRELPPYPNLEYLKKQAKDLLIDMRQRDPNSKLADAQYAIAREYGFSSWPKLKAHVESLPRPAIPPAPLFIEPPHNGEDDKMTNAGDDASIDSSPAAAPGKTNPFVGKWTANLSKSRRHPHVPFYSATLHFGVAGDKVTITDLTVDASGKEEQHENTLHADGEEHPSEYGGYLLVSRWLSSHALEAVVKKNGEVEGRLRYEVSADGATLTILAEDQVIVCDREW